MVVQDKRVKKLYNEVQEDAILKAVFDADGEGWAKANPDGVGEAKDKIKCFEKLKKDIKPDDLSPK